MGICHGECHCGDRFRISARGSAECLVSETAGQNKGTALGTLSLVRQVGLTLAPLYAASLQRALTDREDN
ncbi:hypothetical protein [Bacillus velezensis]|uniref:hypothetical protein n=1 Tax=Bacillus velezensis TaxID=492670 RepID=UPI001F0ECBC4